MGGKKWNACICTRESLGEVCGVMNSSNSVSNLAVLSSIGQKARQVLGAVLGIFLLCLPAFSQGSAGRIQGTITDQSGGALSGAAVTVTDTQRGTSRDLTTDDSRTYNAPSLTPSTYKIRVEAKGFKVLERQNVILEVNGNLEVNVKLQPGDINQTIT